jgi:hypothetical protein
MSPTDEDPFADVERDMEKTERMMESEHDRLERDIEETRHELRDMERATGGAVAGDWRETDDAAGGEDPEGARETSDEPDDEAGRGGTRRG